MLLVLLFWCFLAFCLIPIGWRVFRWLPGGRDAGTGEQPPIVLTFLGLAAVTAGANLWAYAGPIGPYFFAVVGSASAWIVILDRAHWAQRLREWWTAARTAPWWIMLLFGLLVFGILLKSAAPSEMFDEGGYYMPYMRWIEEYRIVPGIANIEDRFGFNSSFHMSSAVFGLSWLVPERLYDLNGFLLVLFALYALGGAREIMMGSFRASAIGRVFGLFFLMRNMVTSASADLSNILLGQTIILMALERIERGRAREDDAGFYAMALLCVHLATIKLSSVFLGLVCLMPLIRMIRELARIRYAALVVPAVLVALPWLGRFPILSGYLVYPMYRIDLFDVDWKVPEEVTRRQWFYVSEFAKTNAKPQMSEELSHHRPLAVWAVDWFKRENAFNKATAIAVLLCMAGLMISLLLKRKAMRSIDPSIWWLLVILAANVAIWFLRNPAFRFGWAWVIQFIALGSYLMSVLWNVRRVFAFSSMGLMTLLVLQGTYKSVMESRSFMGAIAIRPAPPPEVPYDTMTLSGLPVNVSSKFQCWDIPPPCFHHARDVNVVPRGARVEDGFRTGR